MVGNKLSPNPVKTIITMSFPEAIKEIIKGSSITRQLWNNVNEYGLLADGWLTIHTKGEFKVWKVNDGDLLASDWIVIARGN